MNDSDTHHYSDRLIKKLESLDTQHTLDFGLINKAIDWVKKYHDGQFRKSGEPFYTHPLEVAYMIADHKLKTDVIVASILHDIIEDTEVTFEMILEEFGSWIAEMVDRLTRDRPDGTKLSIQQIIENAYKHSDNEVLLIKLMDRAHNLNTARFKSPEKIKILVEETLDNFIILAAYLENFEYEQDIGKLCILLSEIEFSDKKMPSLSVRDDLYQLPALDFRNEINQIYNPIPQEA